LKKASTLKIDDIIEKGTFDNFNSTKNLQSDAFNFFIYGGKIMITSVDLYKKIIQSREILFSSDFVLPTGNISDNHFAFLTSIDNHNFSKLSYPHKDLTFSHDYGFILTDKYLFIGWWNVKNDMITAVELFG
jgi:hypothetical protein